MTKFTKIMVLLIMVPCLALFIGCKGDTGPAGTPGTPGTPGTQGPAGPAGPAGPQGDSTGGGGGGVAATTVSTMEELVAALEAAKGAKSEKARHIIIEGDIDTFYDGSLLEGLSIAEAGDKVNNVLAYQVTGAAFTHYIVDPMYLDGVAGEDFSGNPAPVYISGTPKSDGSNPKINGSVYVGNYSYVIIQNLDIVPDIPVCVNGPKVTKGYELIAGDFYGTVTGAALAVGDLLNTATDYTCDWTDEYAGLVVNDNSWVEVYDSAIDMVNAAELVRTVVDDAGADKEIAAQEPYSFREIDDEDMSLALHAVFVADSANFAYFDEVSVSNTGRYGLSISEDVVYYGLAQIYGGDFTGAEYSIEFNIGDVTPTTVPYIDLTGADKVEGDLVLGNQLTPNKTTGKGYYAISARDETSLGMYFDDYLDDLDDNVVSSKVISDGAIKIALSELTTGSGLYWAEDYGITLTDVTLPAAEAEDFCGIDPIGSSSCFISSGINADDLAGYPNLKKALVEYAKFLAVTEALNDYAVGSSGIDLAQAIWNRLNADLPDYATTFTPQKDKAFSAAITTAAALALADDPSKEEADGKAREYLKDIVLAAPILGEDSIANWKYDWNYDLDYDFTYVWDFSFTYTFDVKYINPLFSGFSAEAEFITENVSYTVKKDDGGADTFAGTISSGSDTKTESATFATKAELKDWIAGE